ncbi:DNA-binding transcriptional regulator, LysR family [Enhydrobacter aerosaccus]|jgi:DNA-binding transcriptional LysR family regulator|uniref:DNA-binding transcriptional regulator, LysR family n=1 Tax=Enhydrobacter aerosaccus TaxID=225324 RepID=A0A1T4M205_9HYPH|nr:DNA-binding transcriptional regulator, LysR family [Enhydrobacter aerosaccus]
MHRNSQSRALPKDVTSALVGRHLLATPEWNISLRSVWHSIVAAEQLSFHRAASVLGTDQSVVSRKIRALEDQLGVSLFERNRAGVRLTRAGKEFINQAKSALSDLDYAVKSARCAGNGSRGQLRIGFFCSLAAGFLRQLLVEFARAHKTVTIDVSHGAPRDHIQQIRDRAMDIAFFTGHPELPDCDVELLWHERVFCVVPEGHPLGSVEAVDWSRLRNETFIVSHDEPGPEIHEYLIMRLATVGFHPKIRRLAVCRESLIHLVAMGFGLTLTSESTIATPFRGVMFKPICGQTDVLPCVGVWSPANDNPALRRFVSLARALKTARAAARPE